MKDNNKEFSLPFLIIWLHFLGTFAKVAFEMNVKPQRLDIIQYLIYQSRVISICFLNIIK